MIKNRIGELVGIRYPLIQAPMNWVSGAALAAAVSNAGGLGTLGPNAGARAITEDVELTGEQRPRCGGGYFRDHTEYFLRHGRGETETGGLSGLRENRLGEQSEDPIDKGRLLNYFAKAIVFSPRIMYTKMQ